MTNIAFLMDPLDSLNLKKDSTLAIIREAQLRDLRVYYFTLTDLVVRQNRPYANFRTIQLSDEFISTMDSQLPKENWYQLSKEEELPLDFMQIIMMRKDPPFDLEYIYATYYLERAEENGTMIVNKPASLRDCNEKFFATAFASILGIIFGLISAIRFHSIFDRVFIFISLILPHILIPPPPLLSRKSRSEPESCRGNPDLSLDPVQTMKFHQNFRTCQHFFFEKISELSWSYRNPCKT